MAHHKKRKPPNARSACKMCKPWKISGMSERKTLSHSEQLQLFRETDDYEGEDTMDYKHELQTALHILAGLLPAYDAPSAVADEEGRMFLRRHRQGELENSSDYKQLSDLDVT